MPRPFNIFHTKVDRVDFDTAFDTAKRFLKTGKTHFIVTPNPEILLKGEKDQQYRNALNSADLRLPDGTGLIFASKLLNTPIPERVTGVDYLATLLVYAQKHQHSVYVLLHEGGLTHRRELAAYFEKKLPKLIYTCQEVSTQYLMSGHLINDIVATAPDILITTFGAPLQELWLLKNKQSFKKTSILFAVGGAFDMLTGRIPRAPRWMQRLSLEWLWRVRVHPDRKLERFFRIVNAVVVFSVKVAYLKFRTLYVYRTNALGFVYKHKDAILVLHKRGYRDGNRVRNGHWALPQGGIEKGEPLIHGVKREVKEEAGITSIGKITPSRHRNKYPWSAFYRNIYSHRYKGQRQRAFFMQFTGDDDEIRLNYIGNEDFDAYAWVNQEELIQKLEYSRQGFAKKLLLEFNRRKVYVE